MAISIKIAQGKPFWRWTYAKCSCILEPCAKASSVQTRYSRWALYKYVGVRMDSDTRQVKGSIKHTVPEQQVGCPEEQEVEQFPQ
ncbi:hypothetical protein N7456_005943 [Penicillium angulare]|uniref:Uncharacterized protein n=1 Tax=Penicillium angulare TaxID=116970 RepID=A0A9W9FZD7_9EURO|nr:hypothetical protein N7456_005943 [Penicillium angulare]